MKKFFALLLALLLPVGAYAETWSMTVTTAVDEDSFAAYIQDALRHFPSVSADAGKRYARTLQTLLNDTSFTVMVQEDASYAEFILNGTLLLDMTTYTQSDLSCMTSSLIPGYALSQRNENQSSQLEDTAINAAASSIENAVSAWLNQLEPTVAYGSFQGDAYSGGTVCSTYVLSDKDVAELVSALATDEVRAVLTQLLTAYGADAAELFSQFDALNARVARSTRYLYILRVVQDDEDALVGLSLTILDERTQLATFSIGMQEQEARAVIGLGLNQQNYWREYVVQSESGENEWNAACFVREWVADKSEAFSYVSKTNATVESRVWRCNAHQSDDGCQWEMALYAGAVIDEAQKRASCIGFIATDGKSMDIEISLLEDATVPFRLNISMKPDEAIPPMDASLVRCSAEAAEDEALYAELNQKLTIEVTKRLLTALPIDVILQMGQWLSN